MRLLDENVLAGMARKPEALKEFPFLKSALKIVEEVCCGGAVRRKTVPDYSKMKAAVAGLSDARRKRFLELAGLEKVRIVWRDGKLLRDTVLR